MTIDDGFLEWVSKYNRHRPDILIEGGNIADGAVSTPKLAAGASIGNIADGAILGAKLADGVVSSAKLADGAVVAAKIAWNEMPAVTLAAWQCSDADTAPWQGWLITQSASLVTLDYTNNIIDPPSLLPPRTGYSRQYRMVAALAHFAAVGETAFRFIVEENFSALGVNHIDSVNLIDRPLIALGSWASNAYLDSVAPDPVRVFLRARSEWAGAAGFGTVRAVTIQGRYVAA